jgi:hypothetical protein
MVTECLTQHLRPQQAPDMVGAERRAALRLFDHRRSPGLIFVL